MMQYAILTLDPMFVKFADFIQHYDLPHEIHLNRTRVWIQDSSLLTYFLLAFPTAIHITDEDDHDR